MRILSEILRAFPLFRAFFRVRIRISPRPQDRTAASTRPRATSSVGDTYLRSCALHVHRTYPTLALKLSYTTRNVRTRFASSPRPLTPLTLGRAVVRPHTRHALTPSNDRGPGRAPESPSILYTPLPRRSPSLSMPRLRGRRSEPHRRRAPARLAASRRPRSDSQRRRCA